MTLLYVVVAFADTGTVLDIQLCGAYRYEHDAAQHCVHAKMLNPHLTFVTRICPWEEDTP